MIKTISKMMVNQHKLNHFDLNYIYYLLYIDLIGHYTLKLKSLDLKDSVLNSFDCVLEDVSSGSIQFDLTLQLLGH